MKETARCVMSICADIPTDRLNGEEVVWIEIALVET
jgi:hypothetical protein